MSLLSQSERCEAVSGEELAQEDKVACSGLSLGHLALSSSQRLAIRNTTLLLRTLAGPTRLVRSLSSSPSPSPNSSSGFAFPHTCAGRLQINSTTSQRPKQFADVGARSPASLPRRPLSSSLLLLDPLACLRHRNTHDSQDSASFACSSLSPWRRRLAVTAQDRSPLLWLDEATDPPPRLLGRYPREDPFECWASDDERHLVATSATGR